MGESNRRQQAVSQMDAEVSLLARVPFHLSGKAELQRNHGMWHGAAGWPCTVGAGSALVGICVSCGHISIRYTKYDVHFWRAGKRQRLVVPSERRRLAIVCLRLPPPVARIAIQLAAN